MISVCIATYNGADVILTQLHSILPQLGPDDEIIISDDRSTDETRALIEAIGDARIKIFDGPALGSPIPNFENALRQAKGDYIFLSDQDDQWKPEKLATMLPLLKQGIHCVTSDCIVTDMDFNVKSDSFYALNGCREGKYFNLLVRNGYLGGCMAFSRAVKDASLPFPKDIPMHDIWIGNVAALRFNHRFLHQSLSYFRRSGKTASTTAAPSQNSLLQKLRIRWIVVRSLLGRSVKK